MKKYYQVIVYFSVIMIVVAFFFSCNINKEKDIANCKPVVNSTDSLIIVDTAKIPKDKFGESVRYVRQLMLNTAYYIGPDGINGKYLRNKMNCTNCQQEAGTKLYSFNLMDSHDNYPQYRAGEGKVLTLAERVNNCIMRPHSGKPLPLDSKEIIAFLSYLKWING